MTAVNRKYENSIFVDLFTVNTGRQVFSKVVKNICADFYVFTTNRTISLQLQFRNRRMHLLHIHTFRRRNLR